MTQAQFNNLIAGLQHNDPRLFEALKGLFADVIRLQLEVFPPEDVGLVQDDAPSELAVIDTFTYTLLPDNILLQWTLLSGSAARFEIREGGSSWETANIVIQTDTSSARIDPLLEGVHTYRIKAINEEGEYSAIQKTVDITVPPIGALSVTAQIIDNNVLLSWSQPTSTFRLSHYIVKKDGVEIGNILSTFTTVFETIAGTYEYSVTAYDIAGNASAEAIVNATVAQPPDYELQANFLSALDGVKTEVHLIDGPRLLCNVRTETYQQHFTDRGWSTIQDQINAGYPLYIHPSAPLGEYQEVIDYGLVVSSTVITVSWNTVLVYPTGVTVQCEIETSLDDITYTPPVIATSLFVASIRYARITFTFTAID